MAGAGRSRELPAAARPRCAKSRSSASRATTDWSNHARSSSAIAGRRARRGAAGVREDAPRTLQVSARGRLRGSRCRERIWARSIANSWRGTSVDQTPHEPIVPELFHATIARMTLPAYAMNQPSFPEMYERWLVTPLFQPWAELIADRVALHTGDRVVDVACGTGIVARTARGRVGAGARVVGIDVSPAMLAVARSPTPASTGAQATPQHCRAPRARLSTP